VSIREAPDIDVRGNPGSIQPRAPPGEPLKNRSTDARGRSTNSVLATEPGLMERGLPNQLSV